MAGVAKIVSLVRSLFEKAIKKAIPAETVNRKDRISLKRLFQTLPDGVVLLDPNEKVVDVNDAFLGIFRFSRKDLLGKKLDEMILPPDRVDEGLAINRRILEDKKVELEGTRLRGDGEIIKVMIFGCPIEVDRKLVGFYGIYRDVTKQAEVEAKVRRLAFRDELCDLPNRVSFVREGRFRVKRGEPFSILYIDLDRFKNVNDTLGHAIGDELLRCVADRISRALDPSSMVSRLGGDEFGVMIYSDDYCDAYSVGKSILDCMDGPFKLSERAHISIGASVGISVYPDHGITWEDLFGHADIAMYEAKKSGRKIVFFDDVMGVSFRERIGMERRLADSLARESGLSLAYQPKVDMSSGEVLGFEALCRWKDGEEDRSPELFIPAAEETGLIVDLGRWVMEKACRRGALWLKEGLRVPLAVNISAKQVQQDDFVLMVDRILEETGFPPELLELELTESTLMKDLDRSCSMLESLKELGVSLAIDDFGTGYSSLAYMARFDVDILKIDRSFMPGKEAPPLNEAIVKSVVALADARGLRVIAEGVETEEQRDLLLRIGCVSAQGFLYSRPVPEEAVADLFSRGFGSLQPSLR
ncbi:diguanylate cyclase/phosphodiesterase with PAS/PAC sensor(s) [Dethiosulfovibrio peptidovorans DSM 11002]|uniref:Diguanylate cyclase/phosphodiesterase with PAS/PAC sensor(S) n=1 Tax=Dethiosulfovibrio peptidovorans DSM 11002 TaxID=469381 RepID=D2Z4R1_9BACT|nr:GGDEF and EAL domain-containing protein [Dethiosulfovibrio peptidovorans]EFC92405.1 diguanylate cyclase/phosphodiesterase with PAS/PAC sensor(s) [Dethiosulfovibrio peptidovorans DSM 11002]